MNRPRIRTVTAGSLSPSGEAAGAGSTTIRFEEDPIVIQEVIPASRENVWQALLQAHQEAGLMPDGMDPEAGLLSLSRFQWSRERNGFPLSLFFDCGTAPSGRSLADAAEIMGSILSRTVEERAGEEIRVSVRVEAWARPFGASGARAQDCTTTGRLERDLLARIRILSLPGAASTGDPIAGAAVNVPPPLRTEFPEPADAAAAAAVEALLQGGRLGLGDRVRIWVSPTQRLTGTFLGVRGDSLLLRRSRSSSIPLSTISSLEVQRVQRKYTAAGALVGMLTGAGLAVTTDLGIGGRHQVQGKILNPGLGAIVGGLVGAGLAHTFLSSSWEEMSLSATGPDPGGGRAGIRLGFFLPIGPGR